MKLEQNDLFSPSKKKSRDSKKKTEKLFGRKRSCISIEGIFLIEILYESMFWFGFVGELHVGELAKLHKNAHFLSSIKSHRDASPNQSEHTTLINDSSIEWAWKFCPNQAHTGAQEQNKTPKTKIWVEPE